jgi:parvulin-like peptidyl-prolyl isomerase
MFPIAMMMRLRRLMSGWKPAARQRGCRVMGCVAVALWTLSAQAEDVPEKNVSPARSTENAVLAKLNGEPITEQAVLRRLQAVHGDVEPYRQDANRWQRMLEAGIEAELRDRLLLQAAVSEKLKVSEQEVQEARERSRRLLGEDRFRAMLDGRGATETDYDVFLRERLLIEKYKAKLFKDITVDEETLRTYYGGHQELFTRPRRAQLETALVQNPEAAQELLKALKTGGDGGPLLGQHDDKGGAAENARRGWVAVDDLPPELRTPLESAKAGDVLEPAEEAGQTRIIRVLAIEEARPLSFEEAREELQATLLRRRQESLLDDWYAQASKNAAIEYLPLP